MPIGTHPRRRLAGHVRGNHHLRRVVEDLGGNSIGADNLHHLRNGHVLDDEKFDHVPKVSERPLHRPRRSEDSRPFRVKKFLGIGDIAAQFFQSLDLVMAQLPENRCLHELDNLHHPLGDVVAPLWHRRPENSLFDVAVDAPRHTGRQRVKAFSLARGQLSAFVAGRDVDVVNLAGKGSGHRNSVNRTHQIIDRILRVRRPVEQRVPSWFPRPLVEVEGHQGNHAVPVEGGAVVHESVLAVNQESSVRVHAAVVFRGLDFLHLPIAESCDLLAEVRNFVVPARPDVAHVQLFTLRVPVFVEDRFALLVDFPSINSQVENVGVINVRPLLKLSV